VAIADRLSGLRLQDRLFIGGEFVAAIDGATFPTLNPHDGSVLAQVAEAGTSDVDRAVDAAVAAFPAWSALQASARGRLLLKLADAIEGAADELATIESLDTGHPIRDSRNLDVMRTAATFRYFGGMADKVQGDVIPVEPGFLNYVVREPLGVVGLIVPWNFPLMFCSWKMGPALAAGNTVILKPAGLTPLSSLRIGELMAEAGIPPGVVNIVPGQGRVAGERLASHPEVRKIAFTGSTATGRRIVELSAANM
jgi:acyl-CoA reductase-like NAD-dependent aldehyde dehydrogenase